MKTIEPADKNITLLKAMEKSVACEQGNGKASEKPWVTSMYRNNGW
jgi:hypothetical protein